MRRPAIRRTTSSSANAISTTHSIPMPASTTACACGIVRGKPSNRKPATAVGRRDAFGHETDHDVVRHEFAGIHDGLGLAPEGRSPRRWRLAACRRSISAVCRTPRRRTGPGCPCPPQADPTRSLSTHAPERDKTRSVSDLQPRRQVGATCGDPRGRPRQRRARWGTGRLLAATRAAPTAGAPRARSAPDAGDRAPGRTAGRCRPAPRARSPPSRSTGRGPVC